MFSIKCQAPTASDEFSFGISKASFILRPWLTLSSATVLVMVGHATRHKAPSLSFRVETLQMPDSVGSCLLILFR